MLSPSNLTRLRMGYHGDVCDGQGYNIFGRVQKNGEPKTNRNWGTPFSNKPISLSPTHMYKPVSQPKFAQNGMPCVFFLPCELYVKNWALGDSWMTMQMSMPWPNFSCPGTPLGNKKNKWLSKLPIMKAPASQSHLLIAGVDALFVRHLLSNCRMVLAAHWKGRVLAQPLSGPRVSPWGPWGCACRGRGGHGGWAAPTTSHWAVQTAPVGAQAQGAGAAGDDGSGGHPSRLQWNRRNLGGNDVA